MKKLTLLNQDSLSPILTDSETLEIQKILNKKYEAYLDDEFFLLKNGYGLSQIQLVLTLQNKDESIFYPIECLFMYEESDKIDKKDLIFNMIDYLSSYFNEFFSEDRNVFFPIDWSTHNFEEKTFYIRGYLRNKKLETEAEELLSKQNNGTLPTQSISFEY